MSRDADRRAASGGEVRVTVAVYLALLAALLPVLPMVVPGGWIVGGAVLSAMILTVGILTRRRGLPALAVSLLEMLVWALFVTAVFFRDTALLWLLPTPETVRVTPSVVVQALDEIAVGAAPLAVTPALSFLIVGALGLLTIAIDHVVLTARMPLLAAVGIIAVSLIPSFAVPGAIDIVPFVLLAAAILFLLRSETRAREARGERTAERAAGVPAMAIGIGAVAIVISVVMTPLLPAPLLRATSGPGGGPGIDASLQLGDDLRRPQEVEVLRVRTSSSEPPYLRATTLSRFDGAVWLPDQVRTVPLDSEAGLGPLDAGEDIATTETTTTVDVVNLAALWAPITYPATDVEGLAGRWGAVPYNRTVISQSVSTQGQSYQVTAQVPRPTLEQIRATRADTEIFEDTLALPEDLPAVIGEAAREVTAGADSDYDALIDLQRWFRGGAFRYSLSAPVEEGFDGSGADAVAQFLEVREGYCIHFASAFALMARTLDMPARIVIGYLPGAATRDRIDDQTVYSVLSSRLHAWPEVYFEGVGWIGFEPTAGLGNPTGFVPAAQAPGVRPDDDGSTPRPTSSATPGISDGPDDRLDPRDDAAPDAAATQTSPLPTITVMFGILLLLALPGLIRETQRRRALTAARNGDSAAAWMIVQDAAIDAGIDAPASESPRAFAMRLTSEHGVPAEPLNVLVRAIERASYAPSRIAEYWHGDDVVDAAVTARAAMMASAPPARRLLAIVAPRSLIVRPGSAYAAGAMRAG
ncbi:transglutaminaseTgpA domain-containing protein [Microbacterium koreense]|uniref:TransglutaminaseTgpA domain-containing protein n=1 Tax=Microbacterium koreense TaxID=323761 RepID=A0ABW2ZQL3_9MICO